MEYPKQQHHQQQRQERYRIMEEFHTSSVDDDSNLTAMVGRLAPSRSSIQNRAHSATTTTTTTTASASVGETPSARALAYEYGSRSCDYINTVAYNNNALNNHYRYDGAVDINEYNDDGQAAKMVLSIRNGPAIKPTSKRIRSTGTGTTSDIPPFRYNNGNGDDCDDCDYNDNGNDDDDDDDDDDVNMEIFDLLDTMNDSEQVDCSGNGGSRNCSNRSNSNSPSNEHSPMTYDINNTLPNQGNLSTRNSSNSQQQQQLRGQYPFFDYVDYSQETDMTPDLPLTANGRVPTFLAKLHAILLRPELQSIVRWLPHGRSWKVYDSVAFEKQVINVYFEFTKHPSSSFFRQAKLWGFLRVKQPQNDDYESLYHPRFLRGLPHLCKDVRRPPTSQLPEAPAIDQEPNLSAISEMYPIPPSTNAIRTDPTIHLDWFMKGKQNAITKSSFTSVPPGKESITKKSSSTSTTASYTSSSGTIATAASTTIPAATSIVKRKRLTATTASSVNQRQSSDRYSSTSSNNNILPSTSMSDHPMQQQQQQQQQFIGDHLSNHRHRSTSEVMGVAHHVPYEYTPYSNYNNSHNINIDIDDSDDELIDDDLGLNLDPLFAKGYQLYPFYDYIDHSMKIDPYPLQPYTDIGHTPTLPMIVHAILLFQQQQQRNSSSSSNQNKAPIIQWQPHGRAFKICSPSKLEKHVLPNFFGGTLGPYHCTTIASFLRHLTRWGFKRIEQRQLPQQQQHPHRSNSSNQIHPFSDVDCYYHPKFLRGLPHLCKDWYMNDPSSTSSRSNILTDVDNDDRTTLTSSDHNDTSNEYPVPDFYKISQLYPIPEYYDTNITIEDLMGW